MRPPAWAARDAMVAAGVITADDLGRFEAAMDRVLGQGATIFGAVGRRP